MWTNTQHEVDEHLDQHRLSADILCVHAGGLHAFYAVARQPESQKARERREAREKVAEAVAHYRAVMAAG